MKEQELDNRLAAALGEAFHLAQGVEDALWLEFVRRRADERNAWSTFAGAIRLANQRLLEANRWSAWPAQLATNLGWR